MAKFNKTSTGVTFSADIIRKVWDKAKVPPNNYSSIGRIDTCGKWIKYDDYGNRESHYSWEMDHIKLLTEGGSDDITNLQVLHWQTNVAKGDKYPWKCGQ